MQHEAIDLWELGADVRCITTNGNIVQSKDSDNGVENIMGAGCAREAVERIPWLPHWHGEMLVRHGQHCFLIFDLVMFPTIEKLGEGASLGLIEQSARELLSLTNLYRWSSVALPRPGAGLGGLAWDDVLPVLESVGLDDRFIIVSYPDKTQPDSPWVEVVREQTDV